jgi:hypothetical protein
LVINPGTQPSIDAGSQRIINVATPTAPSDAVTKDYVDSASVSHALTADYAANAGAADNATYANSSLRATYLGSSFNVTADAEGNLGIGTTSPTQKLDAVGNVNIRDAVSNWSGLTIKPNYPLVGSLTANYISTEKDGTGAHKPIIFRTNDANRLTIDTNGNVGIGTTSPLALLDVNNKLLVSNEQITINAPLNLNLPGDFSLSSDLQFTNPIASYIKSYAPLYIEAGDPNQNYDLILRSAGGGQVVVDDNLNVVGDMRIDGGLTVDSVTMNGNIDMGGDYDITGVNKLTVATIDPVYEIDGEKYASYVADYVGGVRTETSGTIQIKKEKSKGKNDDQNSKVYEYVIDFNDLEKKSDLWLFWETSNKEIDDLVVILTPGFEGKTWYEKKGNKLIIYANESGEVSYRLTAPRLDDKDWSNLAVSEN